MMQFHVRSIRLLGVFSMAMLLLGFMCAMFTTAATAQERAAASPEQAAPPTIDSATTNLKMRAIGPAIMGGRIDDFAVVESQPETIYMGAAAGGVWKTVDGGMTWKCLWDSEPNPSIGALAVAPSNPSVIYVGTGEANNRQSASWGNGVYRSTDAGNTWTHVGLDDTQAIGRIVVDPRNSDVAYVAAVGHLWGANPERGLFKTTDGGKTWNKILFINDDTGVNDVAIDPQSPTTLYAAAYERRRTVWGFNGGGPGSGIYKTTDGGATWNKLTKDLPDNGNTGRIGLAVYRRNPSIVYALVQNEKGGVFRSEDSGATWTKMSSTNPRPSYFSQIRIDPNNDLRIWTGGVQLAYSEDGGKTFVTTRGREVHSDFHAIWIDPNNSNYMLAGCDGGVYESRDAGRDWDHLNVMALGQAYEVGYDNQQPYHVCAGYQDNAEWCGPSRTLYAGGIPNSDWFMVGGGDGFYVKPDAADPQTIYTESQDGNLSRRDLRTNEALNIRPVPAEGQPPYRFNWNSPLLISSKDHNTIYYGGNFLFKSTDRGNTWTRLGSDLTTGVDRNTLPILGQVPTKDTQSLYDGVEWY
ncbi:MAG: WD40/YVTN/BNR-like repeat-containing protein, partial [Candidatus Acidiferrales bacterium]